MGQQGQNLFNFVQKWRRMLILGGTMLLDDARIALLHRETYAAALKGMLSYGEADDFARRLGITPQYLSNLLDPDHAPPSPRLAARMVAELPLDRERRLSLLEHMLLAHERRQRMIASVTAHWREGMLPVLLSELVLANDAANQVSGIEQQTWARMIVEIGDVLLRRFTPVRYLMEYVHIAMIVQNMQSLLNRGEDALYMAKWINAILARHSSEDLRRESNAAHLAINSLYAEVIALRNLKLPKQADGLGLQIQALLRTTSDPGAQYWLPHVLRAQAESICEQPRFTLAYAEACVDQGRRLTERRGDPDATDTLLLLDKALLNAYVAYGSERSLRKAHALTRHLEAQIAAMSLSPIRRAVILASVTAYYRRTGDADAHRDWLAAYVRLCSQAGLSHQLNRARERYGGQVDTVIAGEH